MIRTVPAERLEGLGDTGRGLTHAEAEARRQQYGANLVIETTRGGFARLARETLKDPMLWFLLGTGVVFAVVGERAEALALLIATVPLIGMDAWLHRRTLASTEGLSSRLASTAKVLRDGEWTKLPATALVPGDLVRMATSDGFPADGILVHGDALQADESTLTGEAYPVRKLAYAEWPRVAGDARFKSEHWGFAGTRLLTGEALMRVIYTGGETLYGEIVRSAVHGVQARTPLQSAVANLVVVLVVAAALLCAVLAWVRIEQGHGLLDALLSAVTLAVAALPEEFPVVLTFFLGVGVYRLARRQALVRRAVVVENIGRVSCICSDKTGTLTEGRLKLTHRYPVAGTNDERLLQIAAVASRRETGDPMDIAIHNALAAPLAGEVIASFPFTEDRKRETGILRKDGQLLAAVKGAPEALLDRCVLDAGDKAAWKQRIDELAASGHKVIACAARELDTAQWPGGEPDRDLHLTGLLAFEDPVREGVPGALQQCHAAHIHVIMVTGDHPATAQAVAKEIGLGGDAPRVILGDELEPRLAQEGAGFLRSIDVVARAVPAQKLVLVRALQTEGEIVAVTGDGVNDVPALQAADIGIAMGERGTRSARDVAAIVLLDDNFRSIVRAIAEGRQLFVNLQQSFFYLLAIHIPFVLTAALIPLAGYPLLFFPVHVVWVELIIHPTALLVFQNLPTTSALVPVPRTQSVRFFTLRQWFTILLLGTAITVILVFTYLRSLGAGFDVGQARAMALMVLIAASAGITIALSRLQGVTSRIVVFVSLAISVLLVETPVLAAFLHLRPLHFDDWAAAVIGGVVAAAIAMLGFVRRAA